MEITRGFRWFVVLALVLSFAASSHADTSPPSDPSGSGRPSTVVVKVSDAGFHWTDAGVGAAAMLATTLIAFGVVLALPDRGGSGKP